MLMGGKAAPVSKRSRKKTASGWQVYKSGLGAWGEMGGVKGTKAGKKKEKKPHKYSYHSRGSNRTAHWGALVAVLVLLREHVFTADA